MRRSWHVTSPSDRLPRARDASGNACADARPRLYGCVPDQNCVPMIEASHSPSRSRAGRGCHSAKLTRCDSARSASKTAVWAPVKAWSKIFNVASPLRRNERLSKFVEPTEVSRPPLQRVGQGKPHAPLVPAMDRRSLFMFQLESNWNPYD